MSDQSWNSSDGDRSGEDREEDWGESAPVQPIREMPIPALAPRSAYKALPEKTVLSPNPIPDELLPSGFVAPEQPFVIVPVHFATDRQRTGETAPVAVFANEYGHAMTFGVADVAIPHTHVIGRMELPSIWRLEFKADPVRHVTLLSVECLPGRDMMARVRDAVASTADRQAMLFIHGYNVSFEAAMRRTAQLAFDLKIGGPAIAYSWSSLAAPHDYPSDATNVARTVPALEAFLIDLAIQSDAKAIHVIAHSMGNFALSHALRGIAATFDDMASTPFREVILAAPDIDRTVFMQLATAFRGVARRVTVYASRNDRALNFARRFHGYSRAGQAGDGIMIVPGIDSIDASIVDTSLLGHSYFSSRRSVLDDIFQAVTTGLPADDRFNLFAVDGPAGRYWSFRP